MFVTGGSGFIGGRLIERLIADGHSVRGLARSIRPRRGSASAVAGRSVAICPMSRRYGPAPSAASSRFTRRRCSATGAGARTSSARTCRARATPWRRARRLACAASFTWGRRRRCSPVSRWSTSTRPRRCDRTHQRCTAQPRRRPSSSCLKRIATDSTRSWSVRALSGGGVIRRCCRRSSQMVRSGRWAWIGGGRHRTSTTHVDNTVQGLVLGADRGRPGNVYFVTDGDPVVFRDFVTELLQTQDVEPPNRAVPAAVAGVLASRDRGCVACAPASRPAAAHPLRLLGRFTGVHDQDRQGTQGPRLLTGHFPGGGTHGAALGATRPRHTLSTTALLTLLSGVMPTLDSLTPPHRSSSPNVRRRRPIL